MGDLISRLGLLGIGFAVCPSCRRLHAAASVAGDSSRAAVGALDAFSVGGSEKLGHTLRCNLVTLDLKSGASCL